MMYEMDVSIISGQLALIHVKLEPGEGFEVYGGTSEDGLRVEQQSDGEWLVTLDEQDVGRRPLVRFNLYARQISSGREWVVLGGKILVAPRTADVPGDKLAPVEYCITIPVVENAVDLTGAQIVTGIVGPRGYSAYDIAVMEGFEGTAAEWLESMRQQTATLAVEQVTPLMERAETAADKSEREAAAAKTEQETAAAHAAAAKESELAAAEHKTAAAGEVTNAAAEVTKATAEVEKAKMERETAAGHATAAAKSAQDALANQQGAKQAAQDAALSQVGAETAARNADAASQTATQKASEATASANAAAADKTAAEKAKQNALAAQTKAEQEADKSEQNAALLGDAALMSGDNTFTGQNVFNGALSGKGTLFGMELHKWLGLAGVLRGVPLSMELVKSFFPDSRKMTVMPFLDWTGNTIPEHNHEWNWEMWNNIEYVYSMQTGRSNRNGCPGAAVFPKIKEYWHLDTSTGHGGNFPAKCNAYFMFPNWTTTELTIIMYNGKAIAISLFIPKATSVVFFVEHYTTNYTGTWKLLGGNSIKRLRFHGGRGVYAAVNFNLNSCVSLSIANEMKIERTSLLEMLNSLPAYDAETMTTQPTASLYIDPDLQGDAEVEEALLNLQTAVEDGGRGWTVAVTGITLGGAATFGLRTLHYYARRMDADGAYIDADGQRWDISGGTTVLRNYEANEQIAGYSAFLSLEDALAEWGLHEITPEESKADYERRYGAAE